VTAIHDPNTKEFDVELDEAMRTQHACRYYLDDPVPDEVTSPKPTPPTPNSAG
jgi:hypothetical protein